jgi:hypothetical protein
MFPYLLLANYIKYNYYCIVNKYCVINHESTKHTGIDTSVFLLSLILIPKKLLLHHGSAIELLLVVLSLSSVVVLSDPRFLPAFLHISN